MRYYALLWLPVLAGGLAAQSGTKPKAGGQDYAVHASFGNLSIGAEYLAHSFSGGGETYIAKEYLVVEVALFPAKGESVTVSATQFSLRVNGRKEALTPQGAEFVAASLKYPDWVDRNRVEGGAGGVVFGAPTQVERFPGDPRGLPGPGPPRAPESNPSGLEKPRPVKADELAVETALPEGEHRGPVSGYLYFAWRGASKRVRSVALEFASPVGKVALPLL